MCVLRFSERELSSNQIAVLTSSQIGSRSWHSCSHRVTTGSLISPYCELQTDNLPCYNTDSVWWFLISAHHCSQPDEAIHPACRHPPFIYDHSYSGDHFTIGFVGLLSTLGSMTQGGFTTICPCNRILYTHNISEMSDLIGLCLW